MIKNRFIKSVWLFLLFVQVNGNTLNDTSLLWKEGISVIPYPRFVKPEKGNFVLEDSVFVRINKKASPEEKFAAEELCRSLAEKWNISCRITTKSGKKEIVLGCKNLSAELGNEGYTIVSDPSRIIINAKDPSGLFYGVQTLLQLVQDLDKNIIVKGLSITDWPDIPLRAVHYDTKHFQENKDYVKNFIRTLSSYKINALIWEWEDKFEYKSHPEIGAPGAFTMEEIQELTNYAKKYHIQIIPLVQGLGHVSYILKHPLYKHLREIESNNWGFCPLNEGTYALMTDLIKEAAEATPGSEYIHIGCDETYVLGKGIKCGCREKAEKDGTYALREIYINRISEEVKKLHRVPIAWDGGYDPKEKIKPLTGLFTPGGFDSVNDNAAIKKGYPLYIYDPNPGIEHLFLPYFYRENEKGPVRPHLEESWEFLTKSVRSGKFKGIISTSWNCSGVHNQIWMLRYITAAEYSWNASSPGIDEFVDSYFQNYYGRQSRDIKELFILLNKASYFYMSTFERKVWHWGEVGKTHLPDLPRDDMEFDPYWNTQYTDIIKKSGEIVPQMRRVIEICNENRAAGSLNIYDFELFERLAQLFCHTANTILTLSALEKSVATAASLHFDENRATYNELKNAVRIIENNLNERDLVFNEIKTTWEKSQLPKGMSTPDKKYVYARDQQRNFANRRPDLTFMICDEEDLDLEGYLNKLKSIIESYRNKYLQD